MRKKFGHIRTGEIKIAGIKYRALRLCTWHMQDGGNLVMIFHKGFDFDSVCRALAELEYDLNKRLVTQVGKGELKFDSDQGDLSADLWLKKGIVRDDRVGDEILDN